MNPETKTCQNCHKDFTVEVEDFNFYEKIKVPAPTWCPPCRIVRRFSFQNTWHLSWRNCDKCSKKTLSMYEPYQKLIVYCPECWWADDWDGTEYGMEYDPSRPFFDQMKELHAKTPHVALETAHKTLKNCEYTNSIGYSKDCYLTFWADYCEGVYYSSILNGLKWSSDCIRGFDSELCYESIGFTKNYQTFFSEQCDNCVDVWFSRNCYNCTNCFGCVNLRGASNCIFNVKYSKEEYAEKMKDFKLDSWKSLQAHREKAKEFWFTKPYREYNGNSLNLNVTGEHVYNSKNSKEMYVANGAEDCKRCQMITVPKAKDCVDYSGWGNNASQVYESITVGDSADSVRFSAVCFSDCFNLEYCFQCISGKNDFGCVNLKRKSYCILNKQYSKEEFETLKEKIIEDMKNNPYIDPLGRTFGYGEFFPLYLSNLAYNKSNAIRFFPKDKETALAEGYMWSDVENPNATCTIQSSMLPDTVGETTEKVLEEIIECGSCLRAYRITKGEYDLLRKLNLPIPQECSKCRENKRFAMMTMPGLYHRNCAKCNKEICTPYSEDKPHIVYCEKCYQGEFI